MGNSGISLGADIESIKRFKAKPYKENKEFYRKIFKEDEIAYCISKKNPERYFAARFTGKEAIIKAFMSKGEKITFKDIEIVNDSLGSPRVRLNKCKGYQVKISLSHCDHYALAFAIIVPK